MSSCIAVEVYLEQVLGVGSYGKVCRAKCGQLPCAAKLLHDTMFLHGDPGVQNILEKFEQECRFLSSIKHPNIVQYLASVRVSPSNMPALLMELMDESLTKLLERLPGLLPYHTQLGICHDVALALAYLHGNAIIHRDLSSNNVLVIGAGVRAKVTDFGMSKIISTNPSLVTQCPGTLVYMAPEALTTQPQYSDKLDCFSHGVLTLQILTKNFPNPGEAQKRVEDPRYPNEQLFCQIPEVERRKSDINLVGNDHTLLPIVLDCLKNVSSERPSAEELCVRLSALKEEQRYVLSLEQAKIGAVGIVQQGEELAMKYLVQIQELEQAKNRIIEQYQAKVQSLEYSSTILRQELEKLNAKTLSMERELQVSNVNTEILKEELSTRTLTMTRELEASNAEVARLRKLEDRQYETSEAAKQISTATICVAPNYKLQKDKLYPILEQTQLKKGELWYIVDVKWLKQWKEYVGYGYSQRSAGQEYAHPGPVETAVLLKGASDEELKGDMSYSTVPAAAWDLLVSWYGLSEGSRPIPRKVVYYKRFKEYRVEIYFLKFTLLTHSDQDNTVTEHFSRATTVGQLEERIRKIFSVSREVECRLWHCKDMLVEFSSCKLLTSDPTWTVQDAGLEEGEHIILEIKNRRPHDHDTGATLSNFLIKLKSRFASTFSTSNH